MKSFIRLLLFVIVSFLSLYVWKYVFNMEVDDRTFNFFLIISAINALSFDV